MAPPLQLLRDVNQEDVVLNVQRMHKYAINDLTE